MSQKNAYGVIAILMALLVISAAAGVYYYSQLGQEMQSKNQYISELTAADAQYGQLASNYNASLALSNETIGWLSRTLGIVNTSSPIFQQASMRLPQLWGNYLKLKPAAGSLYSANILIDFGNGTRHWYNNTRVQPGWNMYAETLVLSNGNLQATWYPQYQEHLISGIDGVANSKTNSWFLWSYKAPAWKASDVGADDLPVHNGSVLAWTYCGFDASFNPTCKP